MEVDPPADLADEGAVASGSSSPIQQPAPVPMSASVLLPAAGEAEYDIDTIANYYEGRVKISRLLFIASNYYPLAGNAYSLALDAITAHTLDHALYEQVFHWYRQTINGIAAGENTTPLSLTWYESVKGKELQFDRTWVEQAKYEARSGREKLEVELKGFTTNLIKESIRMGHLDLARFQVRTGDLQGATRSYVKSREFCTAAQHILEMCLGVIEVALELNNYSFVRNYVTKAESALESVGKASGANGKAKATTNMPGMVAPAMDPLEAAKERERTITQERLTVAGGVAFLGLGLYNQAALAFTSVGKETLGSSNQSHFIPPADIALYAVMTGLATFSRQDVRAKLLENADLRPMLDLEPYLRDILRAFYGNNFKEGFRLLFKHQIRQYLDVHLRQHVSTLMHQIRSRAILTYFTPFSTVSISRMASAFGWDEDYLRTIVMQLIRTGELKARIDSQAGVLVAKKHDVRGEAFKNALAEGEKLAKSTVAAQLRMKLIKADVIVKAPPKSQGQSQKEVF